MGMKKSQRWSVLNINITIKKIIRKLEKTYLEICRRQEIQVSKSSVLEELNTVARLVWTKAGVYGSQFRGCVRRQHTS